MHLGTLSMSLAVKDLTASINLYTALGFNVFHDQRASHFVIMQNGDSVIGLFEGMFEGNILTFNPGWDHNAQTVDPFDDVRLIQRHLKANGIDLVREADTLSSGPASCVVIDPDGNTILIDQHR